MTATRSAPFALMLCAAAALGWPGCGSKSGLLSGAGPVDAGDDAAPPSAAICARAEFRSGYRDVALYVLLDRSGSMANDGKWAQASAAIAAFVEDPAAAGVAVGLQYFPRSTVCNEQDYVLPAVSIGLLPDNAGEITASLAEQIPDGETPTLPALRRGIEHARALLLADPSRAVYIALVTDGSPNACGSTTASVAAAAEEGAENEPQVLTFAIGLESGLTQDLEPIAAKGGTGKPIVIGGATNPAQALLDALRSLRDTQQLCRFPVPNTPGGTPAATDLVVAYRSTTDGPLAQVPRVEGDCVAGVPAFFVDDPAAPTHVQLCPGLCELLHSSPESSVTVIAGCGGDLDGGSVPIPLPDGGKCGGSVSFSCVTHCGSNEIVWPICSGGSWECPAGHVNKQLCDECPLIPHACCRSDGTLDEASCIDGLWTCPPGTILYGNPGCQSPDVCDETLPCAVGQYCDTPNDLCGDEARAGSCKSPPSTCAPGGARACGCDGKLYDSGCAASAAGVDVWADGPCTAPPGTFPCGGYFCDLANEVCRTTTVYEGPEPLVGYACLPLSAGCTSGCGCNLCEPCPAGKVCTETCTQPDGRHLACSAL